MTDPWVTVALFGAAIFGLAWLSPRGSREERGAVSSDSAYDQLLEELETENRELLDAVSKFKQEQDDTMKGLVKQIQGLERQMQAMAAERTAVAAQPPQAAAPAAMPVQAAAAPEAAAVVAADPPQSQQDQSQQPLPEPPAAAGAAVPASIRERYADLLAMHRKGRSVEQIAKSAGMNKGEVQLILQLARREEDQLA